MNLSPVDVRVSMIQSVKIVHSYCAPDCAVAIEVVVVNCTLRGLQSIVGSELGPVERDE